MARLNLAATQDDKPVGATLEPPARLYRDLVSHAQILGKEMA